MGKVLVASAVAAVVAVAIVCLLALWWMGRFSADPFASPELSRPPDLVAPEGLGGRQPLFDGRTTAGWEIEGPYRVHNGTLELGGAQAVKAVLQRSLEEGEQIEFDFFQEGSAGAKLWDKPILIDPQPPDPDYCKEFSFDLSLWNFAYRRWHTVRVCAGQHGPDMRVTINVQPQHDFPGKRGGAVHSLPARGGCRHQLFFEVAPGAKLYLRNVLVGEIPQGAEPSPKPVDDGGAGLGRKVAAAGVPD